MSLFAAYASSNAQESPEKTSKDQGWLQNPSFKVYEVEPSVEAPQAEEDVADDKPKSYKHTKRKREGKDKHKTKKKKIDEAVKDIPIPAPLVEESFIIDTIRTKAFLTVNTIARPSVPRYRVGYRMPSVRSWRRKKFKRYYQRNYKLDDKSDTEEAIITRKDLGQMKGSKPDENFTGFKQEEELTQATANYNKKLTENVHDIKLWLEYVNFQDMVYQFEKTYRKGSVAKALRVLAERKLSILDKALVHNQNCEDLLRERLNVAVSIYPTDELQLQLKNLVEKEQGNIILWQGYVEATQCSMSHCNTPEVLNLYIKCLSVLHKLRRNSTMERALLEENILKMLFQCGLFLKQAGLFEQLWTLLRLYLELNLSPSDKSKFHIASGFDENQLTELEDVVFTSQLPLHELWLRTEKLRESCHWLPYMDDGECSDPQRLVFPEDVAELIHPITMPENIFKLTATILTLLKIPLLYCRHSTMQDLGLDYVPWAMDSLESLIPIFLNLYPIDLTNLNFVLDSRFCMGPQYLKILPGQEEYLQFVLTIMKNCIDCLTGCDKIAATVWWLRFQRLLLILDKQNRFKMPQNLYKKVKFNIKNLLKQEENRNNVIYYCEYSLIEYEMGNVDSSMNVLQAALSFSQNRMILASSIDEEQTARCHLHRTLIELHLRIGDSKEVALKKIMEYVLEKTGPIVTINDDLINQTNLKFKHITLQLMKKNFEKLSVAKQFLPYFMTDWIICNGWFLYFTNGGLSCGAFIDEILSELDEKSDGMMWQKEVLFEFYVAVIFRYCMENPGFGVFKILNDVINRAIDQYPNNLFILTVLAKEQSITSCSAYPWWKLKTLLMKSGRAFSIIFLVLIGNQQILSRQDAIRDTVSGDKFDISGNAKNRMLALFRRITRPDMCTRRCGLIWRLYLQFVYSYFAPELCRNVYYTAVEECPWLKALYIDAAIYIPAELAQIQDLIIEKQLRLHVTPEELDVLRN